MTTLYSCKAEIDREGRTTFRITKFDSDMNVESSYRVNPVHCECPAGERPSCRHRDMLPKFLARDAVNTHWLYDYDRGGWVQSEISEALELSCAEAEHSVEQSVSVAHHIELPADSTSEEVAMAFASLANIPSVQVFNMGAGPETIYNAIADAVGEPRLAPAPKLNRRGF